MRSLIGEFLNSSLSHEHLELNHSILWSEGVSAQRFQKPFVFLDLYPLWVSASAMMDANSDSTYYIWVLIICLLLNNDRSFPILSEILVVDSIRYILYVVLNLHIFLLLSVLFFHDLSIIA